MYVSTGGLQPLRTVIRRLAGILRLRSVGGVGLVMLSQGLINVGLGTFSVLYNLYLSALGQSLAYIGAFNALSILALGIGALFMGALSRFISHKRALGIGALLIILVQILLAEGTTPWFLMAGGVVWGVAQALSLVPVAPLLSENVERSARGAVFGRLYATWAVATVVGSVLGGVLPSALAALFTLGSSSGAPAYRAALLAATLIAALALPLLMFLPAGRAEDAVESSADAPITGGWALLTVRRTITIVAITMGLYSFSAGLVAPFFNVYFADQLHLATSVIGALFAVGALLSAVGSLYGPRLARRYGSVKAVTLVRIGLLPCLIALALGTIVPLLAMTGFLIRYALVFMSGALDSHFTLSAVPARSRALASGVRTSAYNLCWALGAWGAGLLIDRVGYSAMFLISGGLTIAASFLFFGLFSLPARRR
jgi:predicted MFS family arabinose efflux permease